MTEIYDRHGNTITAGLQPDSICDEARRAAIGIAADLGEEVYLADESELLVVHPDGRVEESWPDGSAEAE